MRCRKFDHAACRSVCCVKFRRRACSRHKGTDVSSVVKYKFLFPTALKLGSSVDSHRSQWPLIAGSNPVGGMHVWLL
jgi:hypothetical protein